MRKKLSPKQHDFAKHFCTKLENLIMDHTDLWAGELSTEDVLTGIAVACHIQGNVLLETIGMDKQKIVSLYTHATLDERKS